MLVVPLHFPIIGNDSVFGWTLIVEPGQKLLRAPVLRGCFPISIRPENIWSKESHYFLELWQHFVYWIISETIGIIGGALLEMIYLANIFNLVVSSFS